MSIDKLILNSCGWVYLRTTGIDNVYKVGRTNCTPVKRATINNSEIIRLNKSINNYEMENHLKKELKQKYSIYKGTEFFNANLLDIINDFDIIFYKHELNFRENIKILFENSNNDNITNDDNYVNNNDNSTDNNDSNPNIKKITEQNIEINNKFPLESSINETLNNSEKHSTKFECEKCSRNFTTKQSLIYHLDNVICDKFDKTKFKCNECENKYTSIIYLKKHLLKCHPKSKIITTKMMPTKTISTDIDILKLIYCKNNS
jgi:hypothetical protein